MSLLLLIGMIAPAEHAPTEPAAPPSATALNKALLRHVEDDAPPRSESENRGEYLAYDYVVEFARRVPAASFANAARRDVTFANMLGSDAARYRGEVVHIEGKLKRVRDIGPTPGLRAEGVNHLYEAWVFSDLYQDYAHCVLFTELPADVPVAESLDRRVRFDGYFYKIYRYRAGDGERRAPLLVGRTIQAVPEPSGGATLPGHQSLLVIGGAIVGSLLLLAVIGWMFQRSDRRTRQRLLRAHGGRDAADANPFGGEPG